MKRLSLIALLALTVLPFAGFSQKDLKYNTAEATPKAKETVSLKEGTYQFIIRKEGYKPLLSKDFIAEIESKRKENSSVVIPIDEFVDLYLPSKTEINSMGFKPLDPYLYKQK